jgi:hypothetical protein
MQNIANVLGQYGREEEENSEVIICSLCIHNVFMCMNYEFITYS